MSVTWCLAVIIVIISWKSLLWLKPSVNCSNYHHLSMRAFSRDIFIYSSDIILSLRYFSIYIIAIFPHFNWPEFDIQTSHYLLYFLSNVLMLSLSLPYLESESRSRGEFSWVTSSDDACIRSKRNQSRTGYAYILTDDMFKKIQILNYFHSHSVIYTLPSHSLFLSLPNPFWSP